MAWSRTISIAFIAATLTLGMAACGQTEARQAQAAPVSAIASPAPQTVPAVASPPASTPTSTSASTSPDPSLAPVTASGYWSNITFEIRNLTPYTLTFAVTATDNFDWEHNRPDHAPTSGFQGLVLAPGASSGTTVLNPNANARSWPWVLRAAAEGQPTWQGTLGGLDDAGYYFCQETLQTYNNRSHMCGWKLVAAEATGTGKYPLKSGISHYKHRIGSYTGLEAGNVLTFTSAN